MRLSSSYPLCETLSLLEKNGYRVVPAMDMHTGTELPDQRYLVSDRPIALMYLSDPPELDIFYEPEAERLMEAVGKAVRESVTL